MFNRLKEFFSNKEFSLQVDTSGAPTQDDVLVAVSVLLLEMAGKDSDYAPEEVDEIMALIQSEFHLKRDQAVNILELADAARSKTDKIDEFVEAVNIHFSTEQKQMVMAMIWKVVIADGQIDKYEKRFTTQLKNRLMLSDAVAEKAQLMAELGKV